MTIGIIVAVSPEGVIGVEGKIPWHYPEDLRRFKALTTDTTIIMGRKTYESIGRPLPNRRNIVITRNAIAGVECFSSIDAALRTVSGTVWFIGGARIYEEAMKHADVIDMTHVPDHVDHPDAVRFPPVDPSVWSESPRTPHPRDPRLLHSVFTRRT